MIPALKLRHLDQAQRLALFLALGSLTGCGKEPDLVVRVSLDQIFSEELIREFEAETGLEVKAQYDIEQTKTVGHVRAIIEEAFALGPDDPLVAPEDAIIEWLDAFAESEEGQKLDWWLAARSDIQEVILPNACPRYGIHQSLKL